MKKIFTILMACLAINAFAATEPAWYNDVTSITANGQYYIYSVNGAGFMQAGQSKVKVINLNNYNTTDGLVFKIENPNGGTVTSGGYYLKAYKEVIGTSSGPINTKTENGTTIVWTSMNSGEYWNIHGSYTVVGQRYAGLYYADKYDADIPSGSSWGYSDKKDTHTEKQYRWYVISKAHYDRHWAIYLYDRYKETISDYTKWENLVPAAYYTALADAYAVTYDVKNAEHSKEVVNAHRADLKTLYDNAAVVAEAYANAKEAINALEAVEDKGEDFAQITADITAARTALEAAMTVEAIEASVASLKAVDPITFNVTTFEVPAFVTNAATSDAGRTII